MKAVGTTIKNEEIYLGRPVSMVMECEEGVPADTLAIMFLVDKRFDELKYLKLYKGEDLIFNGIVDNHVFYIDDKGKFLKLSVRSRAALLLDNEALPQTYVLPSVDTIFSRHVEPYGFLGVVGESNTTAKEYVVLKGMNEWDVLYKFCTEILHTFPKVTVDNYIDIRQDNYYLEKPLVISDDDEENCQYSLEEDINRYDLISDIHIRIKNDGLYSEVLQDTDALNRGIQKRRYLNLVGGSNHTLSYGEFKLAEAKRQSYKIKVQVQGYLDAKIGMKAELNNKVLGRVQGLIVSKVKYRLNSNRDTIEITLRKE